MSSDSSVSDITYDAGTGMTVTVEAVAKWNFSRETHENLSFSRGNILQIIQKLKERPNVYKARLFNKFGLVSGANIEILPCSWYCGPCERSDSERLLEGYPHKRFLIRRVLDTFYVTFRLRVHEKNVRHFRITQLETGRFTFFRDNNGRRDFDSLADLAQFVEDEGWYSCCWWRPCPAEVEYSRVVDFRTRSRCRRK